MRILTYREAATRLDRSYQSIAQAVKYGTLTPVPMPVPGKFLSEEQVNLFIGKDVSYQALSPEEREEWAKIKALIEGLEPEPPTPTRKTKPERRDVNDRSSTRPFDERERETAPMRGLAPASLASQKETFFALEESEPELFFLTIVLLMAIYGIFPVLDLVGQERIDTAYRRSLTYGSDKELMNKMEDLISKLTNKVRALHKTPLEAIPIVMDKAKGLLAA